jgi:hypothetical protein
MKTWHSSEKKCGSQHRRHLEGAASMFNLELPNCRETRSGDLLALRVACVEPS